MEEDKIDDVIAKEDSEFFAQQERKNHPNFSLEKNENEISSMKREIRWHEKTVDIIE